MAEYRYYLIPDAMTRAFPEQFEKQTPTEFFDNIADLKKRYGDVIVIDREKTDFLIVIFWMMHRIESEVGGHQLIQMVGKGTAKMRNPKWDIFCTSP